MIASRRRRMRSARRREALAGPVVPAMPNLHSHAFQRALAGRTGRAAPEHDDSFWTWRQAMYAFLDRIDADAFEAIAAQAYVEMAKAGYATVAEFHYVHHDPAGKPYADPAELAWRIVARRADRRASASRCCRCSTRMPDSAARRRRPGSAASCTRRTRSRTCRPAARARRSARLRAGRRAAQPARGHAGRAGQIVRLAAPARPIHIHAAEQTREVDECFASTRMRPVEWLLRRRASTRAGASCTRRT